MHSYKTWRQKFADFVPDVELTCGIVIVVVVSCVLSVVTHQFDVSEHLLSLDSNAVIKGHGKSFLQRVNHKNTVMFSKLFLSHTIFVVFTC